VDCNEAITNSIISKNLFMTLTKTQIESYRKNGYLLLENVFTSNEVDLMSEEMYKVVIENDPRRILEKNGAIRSFFAPDLTDDLFYKVVRLDRLVKPTSQLIGSGIYIHQSKINMKHAMIGDWWPWHQDYTYWKRDDEMPAADVLTAMIYLNDVNETNGPMLLIPGSHMAFINDDSSAAPALSDNNNKWFKEYQASMPYMSALTADLKYTLGKRTIAEWAERNGIYSAKGPSGSVLFFHGNIFHASSNNLSPWDRHMFLITYNSINNTLPPMENPRPAFIANRDFIPLVPLPDDAL
jgi:ectoine hydroxylase